jgi:hypothetical protein
MAPGMAPIHSIFMVLRIECERALRYKSSGAMLAHRYPDKLMLKRGGYTATSA